MAQLIFDAFVIVLFDAIPKWWLHWLIRKRFVLGLDHFVIVAVVVSFGLPSSSRGELKKRMGELKKSWGNSRGKGGTQNSTQRRWQATSPRSKSIRAYYSLSNAAQRKSTYASRRIRIPISASAFFALPFNIPVRCTFYKASLWLIWYESAIFSFGLKTPLWDFPNHRFSRFYFGLLLCVYNQ